MGLRDFTTLAKLAGDRWKLGEERTVETTEGAYIVTRTEHGATGELKEPFDRIVVISLDTDNGRKRLEKFFAQLDRVGWAWQRPEVFRAVEGIKVPQPRGWRSGPGAWGCCRSHVAVLEAALADGVKRLLILEDDAELAEDFGSRAAAFVREVPSDWEQLMLGGQFVPRAGTVAEQVSPGVLRVSGVERTHAYAVQGRMMADIYTRWLRADRHIDHIMGPMQRGRRVYAPLEWLAGQAAGKSDIFGAALPSRSWGKPVAVARKKKSCCGGRVLANALGAAGRVVNALATGKPVTVTADMRAARQAICESCDAKQGPKCADCGCFIAAKSALATESCPRGLWQTPLARELAQCGGRILHQVWAQGESELPAEQRRNRCAWSAVLPPGWRMVLWDDAMARAEWADYAAVSDQCSHHAMRCDLILARAQRDFGGLAMGTDVVPHNTAGLFAFAAAVPAFAVVNVPGKSASNGVSWFAEPRHPFITEVCRFQLRDLNSLSDRNVWRVTGPGAWFNVFNSRMWNMATVSDRLAYTRLYKETGIVNPSAWVDAGYAGSWH